MTDTIFINYRREDSIGSAGRLHDWLAQTFGQQNIFMDVDSIPVGVDFVADLNSQVAACDVVLVVIGPNWLDAKDESGRRRLDNPDDFVAIEIAAALARDIHVIPVLVDGARMPKASELPDPIKSLVRRNAFEMRNAQFRRDADALISKVREALGDEAPDAKGHEALGDKAAGPGQWRVRAAIGAAAVAVLILIGWGGYEFVQHTYTRVASEAVKADAERRVKTAAEAEAKRKADKAEQERLAAEQKYKAFTLFSSGKAYFDKSDYDRAIADFNEAIRLDPKYALAFHQRGNAYGRKGDSDRAIADLDEAIRLNPQYADSFVERGNAYLRKGDQDRAIADYTEAIRLYPTYAIAFNNRGLVYQRKADNDRALADFNEAIRLDPKYAHAFCNRGRVKLRVGDATGNADIEKGRELDASYCR
jgi:tetratricopeptide (TPR) repeat protein